MDCGLMQQHLSSCGEGTSEPETSTNKRTQGFCNAELRQSRLHTRRVSLQSPLYMPSERDADLPGNGGMVCHAQIWTECLHALAEYHNRQLTWLDTMNEVSIVHELRVQPDGEGVQRLAITVRFTTPLGTNLHPHAMLASPTCTGLASARTELTLTLLRCAASQHHSADLTRPVQTCSRHLPQAPLINPHDT